MPDNKTTPKKPEIYFKSRPKGINPSCVVFTYSVTNSLQAAINTLSQNGNSVHYLIDIDGSLKQLSVTGNPEILKYIDANPEEQFSLEQKQTFYAAKESSMWRKKERTNEYGIGIMFINDAKSFMTDKQMDTAINLLTGIRERHPSIDFNRDIVSLGEVVPKHIAVKNSLDYKKLSEAGFSQFIETTDAQRKEILITKESEPTKISELQTKLKDWGYAIEINGKWDWDASDPEAQDPIKKYQSTAYWVTKFDNRYVPNATPDQAEVAQPAAAWTEAHEYVLNKILNLKAEKTKAETKSNTSTSSFFKEQTPSEETEKAPESMKNSP